MLDWPALRDHALAGISPTFRPPKVQLPALPYAVTLFALRSRDEKVPLSDLAKILETDSGLTTQLLKHVNSAYLGVRHKIASVAQALSLLGCQRSRHFMLATGMEAAIRAHNSKLINQNSFWNTPGVPTVERTRLSAVLTELALQRTGRFDDKSQQRIGKQVGAVALITGSTIPSTHGGRRTQVSVRMTDVQSGAVLYAFTHEVFARGMSRANAGVGFPTPDTAMPTAPSKALPTQWRNETYNTTLRCVNGNEWAEFENWNNGRLHIQYTETGRNKDYLELFCAGRSQNLRVLFAGKRMEIKKNGKWEWVATGHWETEAEPAAASERPGSAPASLVDRFAGRWRMLAENGSPEFVLTLERSFDARKSHVPGATGRWHVVGDEVRIKWSDGWTDTLKVENGRAVKVAFAPGTGRNAKPANTQQAVKE